MKTKTKEPASTNQSVATANYSQNTAYRHCCFHSLCVCLSIRRDEGLSMDRLHDTRAPFWTGIGTGSRARQVQDPNGGSRVSFRFWPRKKTIPSSSLHFWPQRRRYTCILFCRANFRAVDQDTTAERAKELNLSDLSQAVNLKLEVAWPWTWSACAADSCWWIY